MNAAIPPWKNETCNVYTVVFPMEGNTRAFVREQTKFRGLLKMSNKGQLRDPSIGCLSVNNYKLSVMLGYLNSNSEILSI